MSRRMTGSHSHRLNDPDVVAPFGAFVRSSFGVMATSADTQYGGSTVWEPSRRRFDRIAPSHAVRIRVSSVELSRFWAASRVLNSSSKIRPVTGRGRRSRSVTRPSPLFRPSSITCATGWYPSVIERAVCARLMAVPLRPSVDGPTSPMNSPVDCPRPKCPVAGYSAPQKASTDASSPTSDASVPVVRSATSSPMRPPNASRSGGSGNRSTSWSA